MNSKSSGIPIVPSTLIALILGVVLFAATAGFSGIALSAERAYAATDNASEETLDIQAGSLDLQANPSKAQRKAFKKAAADFSIELFQRCVSADDANANVTISPMSVMSALAVTANGASGATSDEMLEVLADGMSMNDFNTALSWYNNSLFQGKKARLSNANSIWYHNDGSLVMKNDFLKACQDYYNAEVRPADFSDQQTVATINDWVATKTNNMIKQAISRLDPNDRLAIINALYFDAKWSVPYDSASVYKEDFTNSKGKTRWVEMMHGTEHTYIEGDGVVGFIKPYAKGYSYVALLPDEGVSLKDFTASLTGNKFRSIIKHATRQTVDTTMPKQSLSYTNEAMKDQLEAMGISTAFTDSADFSNMVDMADGSLSIDSVVHKTKVEVDEKGTKAAAVTAIVAGCTSISVPEHRIVNLDRPFVYAIVDNKANLPIFIGAVNNV